MRTKIIALRTGDKVTLYMNEETNMWVRSVNEAQDVFYKKVLNGTTKEARTIRKYYSGCTIPHTRKKIRQMVNEGKIDQLCQTIINIKGH